MRKVDTACRRVREVPLNDFAEATLGRELFIRWRSQHYAEKVVCSIFRFYYRAKYLLKDTWDWLVWAFQKYILLDGVRAEARRKEEDRKIERWKVVKQAIEDELEKRDAEIQKEESDDR